MNIRNAEPKDLDTIFKFTGRFLVSKVKDYAEIHTLKSIEVTSN